MRFQNSTRNAVTALIGQVVVTLTVFFGRMIFLRILSIEYLGINALFTNIISLLSLMELGVGATIVYSLYRHIEESDTDKINGYIALYRKIYILVGMVVILIGIILVPFYQLLINDTPNVANLDLIFFLFIINTAFSYFFAYRKSIFIASQVRYVVTLSKYISTIVLIIIQTVPLILFHNYIVYLLVMPIITLCENIFIHLFAGYKYPYLRTDNTTSISRGERKRLFSRIKAMFLHRVGGVVVLSTDNIIISKMVGLTALGLYSNYYLVIYSVGVVLNNLFASILASIGNLYVNTSKEIFETYFYRTLFFNFAIVSTISVFMFGFLNSFISMWIGEQYLLSQITVSIIVLNFYVLSIRKTIITYKEATGAFYYDRYRPVFESVINLIASILLAVPFGLNGVLLGTSIAMFSTMWYEINMLYKRVFLNSPRKYYAYMLHFLIFTLSQIAIYSLFIEPITVSISPIVSVVFRAILLGFVVIVLHLIFMHLNKTYGSSVMYILDKVRLLKLWRKDNEV